MKFYKASCSALSTFNEQAVNSFKDYGCELKEVLELPVMPLKIICEQYVQNKKIDFLSVDVEGFDLEVLKSNDWNKYRPTLIMIEINQDEMKIDSYMKEIGYSLKYKNHTNGIYLDE